MAINFLLKRSSVASKRPTAAQLDIGELSLNYDQGTPGLFFEDDAGAVRKIGPTEVGGTAPNASPAGQSGNSIGEMWLDNSGTALLKTWDGSAWQVAGVTTIGSTSIALGATSTTLAGLTSVTSTNMTVSTALGLSNQADLKFFEATANGSNYVGFQAPSAIGADVLWTLPSADGSAGQVLKTDGAGVLSWVAPSVATAAGSDTQVQYNSSGSFAGSSNLTFDGTDLTCGGDIIATDLFPPTDNTGVVGDATKTWSNGQFTNLTVDSTLNVRAAIDLADSDVVRFGSSDDTKLFYDGTANDFEVEMESTCNRVAFTNNGTYQVSIERTDGAVRLYDSDASNYVAVKAPATVSSDVTWTLPSADGTSGQALVTNGSGTLAFATVSADFGQSVKTVTSNTTVPTQAGYNQVAFYSLDIDPGVTFTISAGEVFSVL